ncbi:hypothetical protein K402DRAFT_423105 [Aulographum hederae CBS 113979]|uniref:Gfd2/YDR514C-like C-terminal domain-containing protein n=1 Tax=Aulographum hederae CBS 113979 TaxID=1176131 RepID=A0A6G1GTM3_9PEZI|nr:hypothetical protein K402DRAFT_423105 [Aulographum hederae CBS 113979]
MAGPSNVAHQAGANPTSANDRTSKKHQRQPEAQPELSKKEREKRKLATRRMNKKISALDGKDLPTNIQLIATAFQIFEYDRPTGLHRIHWLQNRGILKEVLIERQSTEKPDSYTSTVTVLSNPSATSFPEISRTATTSSNQKAATKAAADLVWDAIVRSSATWNANMPRPRRIAHEDQEIAYIHKKARPDYDLLKQMALLCASKQPIAIMAIDVEAWEWNTKLVTEVGSAWVEGAGTDNAINSRHWVPEENKHRRNKKFAPDARDKFAFGVTVTQKTLDIVDSLREIMESLLATHTAVFLVGHSIQGDVKWLKSIGLDIEKMKGWVVCDIANAERFIATSPNVMKFENIMRAYGIDFVQGNLHNAGNDAAYTLQTTLKLMDLVMERTGGAGR